MIFEGFCYPINALQYPTANFHPKWLIAAKRLTSNIDGEVARDRRGKDLLEKICNNTQKFYVTQKHDILKFIIKHFDQTIKNVEQGSFHNFIKKTNKHTNTHKFYFINKFWRLRILLRRFK